MALGATLPLHLAFGMGAVDKKRRNTGSLTVARNFLILTSCFLLGLFSIKLLKDKFLSKSSFVRLSAGDSPQRCPPLSITGGICNCTTASTVGGPPEPLSSNPRSLTLNPDGKAESSFLENSSQPRPDLLLFVGILSGRGYRHRRLAVRESWANRCQVPGVSVCRFILSEDEETPQVPIGRSCKAGTLGLNLALMFPVKFFPYHVFTGTKLLMAIVQGLVSIFRGCWAEACVPHQPSDFG